LEQTIKSVLEQKYPNLEYIVMDGGSSDNSVDIIKKYSAQLSYWESEKDKGQSDAIHRGFGHCTGDLIGWINSDDIFLPNAFDNYAKAYMSNPGVEFISGGSVLINSKSRLMKSLFGFPCIYSDKGLMTYNRIAGKGFRFLQPGSIWSRAAYYEVGGIDTNMVFCFDRDLFIRLSKRKPGIGIGKLVAGYRIHGDSKTSKLQGIRKKEDKLLKIRYQPISSNIIKRYLIRICVILNNKLSIIKNNANYLLGKYPNISKEK